MANKKIKAVVFDYWNTLASCEVNEETLKDATMRAYDYLKNRGYEVDFNKLFERRKSSFLKYNEWAVKHMKELTPEESFKKYLFYDLDISEEDLKEIIKINEMYDHKHKFKKDLKETLIKLKGRGYKLGILSNAWTRLTFFHLDELGIRDLFDSIILSCDHGIRKPSKEIFDVSIKQLNVMKEECVFVGDDHEDDIFGAKNYGIPYAFGMKPIKIKPEVKYMPNFYIEEIYEIEDLINKIHNVVKVPISVGELVDKITILKIKMTKITDPDKLENIRKEFLSLLPQLKIVDFSETDSHFEDLFKINSELWDIEDKIRIREGKNLFDEEFIKLARMVYKKNDERAKIKKDINVLSDSELHEEKDYVKY